jgi:hypothetical protein
VSGPGVGGLGVFLRWPAGYTTTKLRVAVGAAGLTLCGPDLDDVDDGDGESGGGGGSTSECTKTNREV